MRKVLYKWRNPDNQPLRIKSSGQVDIVASMMMFLVLWVAILFSFRTSQYMVTAAGVEDALAASNLASAVIDLEEYGQSHVICIPDAEAAFWMFQEALCCNLGLDQYLNSGNKAFLAAPVEIKEYIVYNVREEQVEMIALDGKGRLKAQGTGIRGQVYTPDNVCVETTTVYSRVGYLVEGLMGQYFYGEKEKSIDITRCDGE